MCSPPALATGCDESNDDEVLVSAYLDITNKFKQQGPAGHKGSRSPEQWLPLSLVTSMVSEVCMHKLQALIVVDIYSVYALCPAKEPWHSLFSCVFSHFGYRLCAIPLTLPCGYLPPSRGSVPRCSPPPTDESASHAPP